MDGRKILARHGVAFVALLWLLPSTAQTATAIVDCNSGSLQTAIDLAKPGDTLVVNGTCKENLVIPEEAARVVLDGRGNATISGPDAGQHTILVRGRGITIRRLTVTGGRCGISVNRGGQAFIDGNIVERALAGCGIDVGQHSFAVIVNNTIQNNPGNGIMIGGSSFVFLGLLSNRDKTASPNTIQNNGRNGIEVHRSSSARIVGNTIRHNKLNGIDVNRASHADISSNVIDANGLNGIRVTQNSAVQLGSPKGTGILDVANTTTAANAQFAISCAVLSSADGRLGKLAGSKGDKEFDPSCASALSP